MPDNTSLKQTHNSDSTSVSAPQTVGVKTRQNNSESGTNERSTAREQVKTGAASEESEYAGSELKAIMEQENQRTAVKKSSLLSGAAPAAEDETNNTLHDSAALFSKPAGETVKPAIAVRNADSAQLAFQPAVDSQEVLEQIVQKAELLNKQENSEIRIQLKPEFLGKMIIKIAVQEGAVTAHFVTDNHNVKHILETNMQNLRQNLEASGLKVERTEVNVSLDSGRNYSDSDQSRQFLWQEYASRQNYLSQGRESGQYGKDADYTITQTLEEDIADNDVESYQGIYHGRVNFTI
jgi:flagellar hook-length control protein FliK